MAEENKIFTPIKPNLPPPKHCELRPRCYTCRHYPICNIRQDYLKTARLIENILGNPCDSYKLNPCAPLIPNFDGTIIENYKKYFPETVKSTTDKEGKFYMAKYCCENCVKFVYIFEGYYVLFIAKYNKESKIFEISSGKEICYNLSCTIADDLALQDGLLLLKADIEKQKDEQLDVINTTYFSAQLDCQFYEWEKGLTYEEGKKRICSCALPLSDCNNKYYHLATYHTEDEYVPCYYPEIRFPAFSPMPYPPNFCNCKKKKTPKTRDELNE